MIFCCYSLAYASLFYNKEAQNMLINLGIKVDILQQDIYNKATKNSVLNLANQNNKLHDEISKLRGKIELLTNTLDNFQQNEKKSYVNLHNRLLKLEEKNINN